MKIKTIIAASALAATAAIGAVGQSASAGCGLSVEAHNLESGTATVQWNLSKVRAAPWGVPGTWATIGSTSWNYSPGQERTRAVSSTFGCGTARQYKLYVTEGGNSWYEYFPTNTNLWTTNTNPHIHLDR